MGIIVVVVALHTKLKSLHARCKDGTLLYGEGKKQASYTHIGNFVCGTSVCQMKLLQVRVFSNRFSNLAETLHGNILPQHSIECRYQPEIQCNGKLSAKKWDFFHVAQVRQHHQTFNIWENLSGLFSGIFYSAEKLPVTQQITISVLMAA